MTSSELAYAVHTAVVNVGELDANTEAQGRLLDEIVLAVEVSLRMLIAEQRRIDPLDRGSLLDRTEQARMVATSLCRAAAGVERVAATFEAAGLLAFHRAPLPLRPLRAVRVSHSKPKTKRQR